MPAVLVGLFLLLIAGCSDNEKRLNYSYLRSAAQFQVDTASTDMGCDDPGPNFSGEGGEPSATCRSLRKYVLSWQQPDDTADFRGYRLYLDTTPPPASKSWRATQSDDAEAAVVIPWSGKASETLIFFFYDGRNPPPGIQASRTQDTLYPGKSRVFALDTSGRLEDSLERFVIALATRFDEGTQGQPQYINMITGDKLRPMPFQPTMRAGDRELDIDWARPRDMVSDFNRALDTGIIAGYVFTLKLFGGRLKERGKTFNPEVVFVRGGDTVSGDFLDSVDADKDGIPKGRTYYFPDGGRASRGTPTVRDSLALRISNLMPLDSLEVILYALDSAGNDNLSSMQDVTVILTDTTRPSMPELAVVDSLTTRNRIVLEWTASRDSADADGDGKLEPAARPNGNIARYLLSRVLQRGPGDAAQGVDRRDTVIEVTSANQANERFRYTADYLPPGKTYLLTLTAVDSSGFPSAADSIIGMTDSIRFAGGDSGLACPPGFIPIPAARFQFGETGTAGDPDEKGPDGKARLVQIQSYCIEPYEHRDSAGGFVTRVTWDEADRICRDLAPADSSRLCSEAQWERACEGFDAEGPHPHGIQSENDASILQTHCNQATGDSAMAMRFDKRRPVCLTNEGVFDMAGNLSEWVRDVYDPGGLSRLRDTVLGHGFSFAGSDSAGIQYPRSVRGGNFLKLDRLPLSKAQSLARCSNRDYPAPIRPKVRRDCVDPDHPLVALVYGEGLDNFRCFGLPGHLQGAAITDVLLDPQDSSQVRVFVAGNPSPEAVKIPQDTVFRGRKPLQVLMTPQSLAEVAFELVADPDSAIVDTLDAGEMRFASESDLLRILERESPSKAWTPRKADGRIAIRKLYAYALSGTKPAKPYMASRSIGFRCCALPRPKPPVVVTEDPIVDSAGSPAGDAARTAKRSAPASP